MQVNLHNCDCMAFMADIPDQYYDLAVVDPPYGLPKDSSNGRGKLKNRAFNTGHISTWDTPPKQEYFSELFRVSKNQIIWGGNYFGLPPCRCFLVWDKIQPWKNFSQCEYAWTSFSSPAKIFQFDNRTGGKIHPTQKPVALYNWIFREFVKEGDKVLDTHGGSMSSAIAAYDFGDGVFDLCEIDPAYFAAGKQRFEAYSSQGKLF